MPMPAQKPATTPIPVQLSEAEFNPFILPHLSMPRRGPKCKLGYHRLFNLIPENPRNRKRAKRGRKRWFNAAIHTLRDHVERTFAWEDKFKRLLLRIEHQQRRHYGMKLMAYTLINLRGFCAT
jgi:transposase